jgi:DNA repair protein RecN (Recombination protein N)
VLSELRVQNLGIIAELRLVLGPGLTAITGETGAGKTLVVSAVELLVGGRADASMVRPGAAEAAVEGRFVTDDPDADEVVLARVIPVDGRSRAYVNGRLATAGELAELGATLVDLHGQHAHQSLLLPAVQRALLDRFAGAPAGDALRAFRAARAEQQRIEAELAPLGGDERARARELDLLRYQVAEIDAAAIADPDEDDMLAREELVLGDATAHREALEGAFADIEGAAEDATGRAVAALSDREPFAGLAERLRAVQAELGELAHDLRLAGESVVADPERLVEIGARRRLLQELRRKYGETLAEILEFRDDARGRLAEIDGHEARVAQLESARAAAAAESERHAAALTAARRAAAEPLARAVTAALQPLAMPGAEFVVAVEPAREVGDDGADAVTFLLAANPGEPASALARVASGGELSRTMLALRVVLSAAPPTLVFDEVDSGLGGEAGVAVGEALARLGSRHQVLSVTHLAQVAAYADAHVTISKHGEAGRTLAGAELLLEDARVGELARMLSGVDSAGARLHAEELLRAARKLASREAPQPSARTRRATRSAR